MKKVLHFIHGLNLGGAETFLCNCLQSVGDNVESYFVVQDPVIRNPRIKEYIDKHKHNIFIIPDFRKSPIKHFRELKRILMTYEFDFLQIHMNSLVNPLPIIAASNVGIQVVLHSHSTKSQSGVVGLFLHKINRKLFVCNKHVRIACSDNAGKWMYGNRPFGVIDNSIPISEYMFNEALRMQSRHALGIPDENVVLGSVGRLVPAKNHILQIEIFDEYHNQNPKSTLIIVGDGKLKESLKQYVESKGLRDDVTFTGMQNQPLKYYCAMDCFLMPSLFEGLPFTAIEAQASGLPVIASDCVPQNIQISDMVTFHSLNDSVKNWVKSIELSLYKYNHYNRIELGSRLFGSKYDIETMSNNLKKLYRLD